jgi:bile acid:Na+ symporter, BASS family
MPPIAEVLLPAALAFIMFSVGITLVPADFTRLVREPRAVTAGLIGQLLVLPLAPGRSPSPGGCPPRWPWGS